MHEMIPILLKATRLTLISACATIALQTFWMIMLPIVHRISGHHERTIRYPANSIFKMLLSDIVGYSGYMFPWCLAEAWLSPAWSYEVPHFALLGYWCTLGLLIGDFYYYTVHRWFHLNKSAFHFFHSKHHDPSAQMDISSAGHVNFFGAIIEGGMAFAVVLVATAYLIGNWWYVVAPLHIVMSILVIGHTGQDLKMETTFLYWVWVAPNPLILWYFTNPIRNDPNDHEDHHLNPRSNFGPFFSVWDDIFGTSATKKHPCSLLILVSHAIYQATLVATGSLLYAYPLQLLTAYIMVYVMVAPTTAASVVNALKLPELVQSMFGWLMDWYRTDSVISYVPQGQPGAFARSNLAEQNAEVKSNAVNTDDSTERQQAAYVFGCHPAGILSRGAFHTFALKGWKSPVSSVKGLRFAIGSQFFYAPILLIREFLSLVGCIPADKATLEKHLRSGNSVALTPGGFKEHKYMRTNTIVLEKRKGFVALAHDTGAALVPVLCVGEQDVVIPPRKPDEVYKYKGMKWWIWTFLLAHRPYPIKVVFGPALSAAVGESVDELHARYTEALLLLGKQHGMELQVV